MSIKYNMLQVNVHLDRLRQNLNLLRNKGSNLMVVIKADAYGHGLGEVASMLEKEGVTSLAVGTVQEGADLRQQGCTAEIICLLGAQDGDDAHLAWEFDLTPMIYTLDQITLLHETRQEGKRLRVGVKFDTGMARLGFSTRQRSQVAEALIACPELLPTVLYSHMASADEPSDETFVLSQGKAFTELLTFFQAAFPDIKGSLANSATLLAYPKLHFDLQRPGISFYGTNPFANTPMESKGAGLRDAMEVTTKVLQVHSLNKGQSISYGRTFTAKKDMQVAIVAAGYADNYSRGLSNKGFMYLKNTRVPIVGRVCMQMTALDISKCTQVNPGDSVWLLGGDGPGFISAQELADWWGTITYEVFCVLGQNRRTYVDSA